MHDDAPKEIGSEENAVLVVPFREDNAGERTLLLGEIAPLQCTCLSCESRALALLRADRHAFGTAQVGTPKRGNIQTCSANQMARNASSPIQSMPVRWAPPEQMQVPQTS